MKTTLLFTLLTLFSVNSFSQTTHVFYIEDTGWDQTPGEYTIADTVVEVGDLVQFVNSYYNSQFGIQKNGQWVPGYDPTFGTVSVGQVIYQYQFTPGDTGWGVDIYVGSSSSGFIFEYIHFTVVEPSSASLNEASTNNYSVYPNPATDVLNISGDHIESVQVFDLNGRMVLSGTTNKVDVSALQPGVYTVLVNGEERQRVVVE